MVYFSNITRPPKITTTTTHQPLKTQKTPRRKFRAVSNSNDKAQSNAIIHEIQPKSTYYK